MLIMEKFRYNNGNNVKYIGIADDGLYIATKLKHTIRIKNINFLCRAWMSTIEPTMAFNNKLSVFFNVLIDKPVKVHIEQEENESYYIYYLSRRTHLVYYIQYHANLLAKFNNHIGIEIKGYFIDNISCENDIFKKLRVEDITDYFLDLINEDLNDINIITGNDNVLDYFLCAETDSQKSLDVTIDLSRLHVFERCDKKHLEFEFIQRPRESRFSDRIRVYKVIAPSLKLNNLENETYQLYLIRPLSQVGILDLSNMQGDLTEKIEIRFLLEVTSLDLEPKIGFIVIPKEAVIFKKRLLEVNKRITDIGVINKDEIDVTYMKYSFMKKEGYFLCEV